MNTYRKTFLTALVAFAGGYVVATLTAPRSGRHSRRLLMRSVRVQAQWVTDQLHALEERLATVEAQIHQTGDEFGHRVREATGRAIDHYIPDVPDDTDAWHLDNAELMRDLRRMPHR